MFPKISTRHHYIPAFYSKGFTNSAGFFYIYDKQKDILSKKERSPKSVFFENDRNTMHLELETSILEDTFFKELDDKCKVAIENLREKPNTVDLLNTENSADVDVFVLNLFWRTPKTDYAFERFMRETEITFTDKQGKKVHNIEKEQLLKNDESYKKFLRAFLPSKFLRAYLNSSESKQRQYLQLYEKQKECFLLGDYPMVFSRTPKTGDDLFEIDFYLPISSTRLYYAACEERKLEFDFDKIVRLNALIINQSHRYICGPNLEYLKKSIDYYKSLKEKNLLPLVHCKVFTA
jgi:hypothetical protein